MNIHEEGKYYAAELGLRPLVVETENEVSMEAVTPSFESYDMIDDVELFYDTRSLK